MKSLREQEARENLPRIEYPDHVDVLLTATQWTRITEPLTPVNLSDKVAFYISKDDTDCFAVTKKTGIVYIKYPSALERQFDALHKITLSWNLTAEPLVVQSKIIVLSLNKPEEELTCTNDMNDETDNFCAKFKVKLKSLISFQ